MGILANNENKILRSNQTGRILKQNYNFGNGFPMFNSSGIKLKFNKEININEDIYFYGFSTRIGGAGAPGPALLYEDNTTFLIRADFGVTANKFQFFNTPKVSQKDSSFFVTDNESNLTNYHRLYYLIISNRALSDNEIVFINNNLLGGEPLNLNGFFGYYKFDVAENINNIVVFRDFSNQNNHCELVDLPAGTIQEQIDFVNNNILES